MENPVVFHFTGVEDLLEKIFYKMTDHYNLFDALQSGLQLIQAHSIQRYPDFVWHHAIPSGMDWEAFHEKAWRDYRSVQTPTILDVCSVLDRALVRLEDNHSFLQYPGYRRNFCTKDTEKATFQVASALTSMPRSVVAFDPTLRLYAIDHSILHLIIPCFYSSNPVEIKNFQNIIRNFLLSENRNSVSAVIVDLLDNVGGNMWPMLWGLSPLLGPDKLGDFGGPTEQRPWHVNTDNAACFTLADKPVAVLCGSHTSSSGEAVLLAFRGRPNTKSFGGKTDGRSTCNDPFYLKDCDNLILNVCTSILRDRKGFGSGNGIAANDGTCITPDHEIQITSNASIPEWRQRALQEAISWIRTRAPQV